MVSPLHSVYFPGFCSLITILHSTWHTIFNQPHVQTMDIHVMGYSGNERIYIKVDVPGLQCSPLCRNQRKGHHLQIHRKWLQDGSKTFESIIQHLRFLILHLNLLPLHLGPPISLPTKRFQPCVEPRKTTVAGIADWFPLQEIPSDDYNVDDESNDSSDLDWADCKPPISLKHSKFSLKQFAKRMAQANCSEVTKWKNIWVAGYLEKKHWFRIHSRIASVGIAMVLCTGRTWLPIFGDIQELSVSGWIR